MAAGCREALRVAATGLVTCCSWAPLAAFCRHLHVSPTCSSYQAAAVEDLPPDAAPAIHEPPQQPGSGALGAPLPGWQQVLSPLPGRTRNGRGLARPGRYSGALAPSEVAAYPRGADVALGKLARPQELMKLITGARSPAALLHVHRVHGERFDALHVAAAIARTASVVSRVPDAHGRAHIRELLGDLAPAFLVHIDEYDARQLSNAVYAMGKLSHRPGREWRDAVTAALVGEGLGAGSSRLAEGNTQDLANLAMGLAWMECRQSQVWHVLGNLATSRAADFTPQGLACLLWAMAASGRRHIGLMHAVQQRCASRRELTTWRGQHLATLLWAAARMGCYDAALFDAAASATAGKAMQLRPKDVANIAWALAASGHRHDPLFRALAKHATAQLGEYKTQHVAALGWAFAQLPHMAATPQPELPHAIPTEGLPSGDDAADARVACPPPSRLEETQGARHEGAASSDAPQSIAATSVAVAGTLQVGARGGPRPPLLPPEVLASHIGLWASLEEAAISKALLFKPADLTATVWALARNGHRCVRLLEAAAAALARPGVGYDTEDAVELLAASAAVGASVPALNSAAAALAATDGRRAPPAQLAATVQLLARLGHHSSEAMDAAAHSAVRALERGGLQSLDAAGHGGQPPEAPEAPTPLLLDAGHAAPPGEPRMGVGSGLPGGFVRVEEGSPPGGGDWLVPPPPLLPLQRRSGGGEALTVAQPPHSRDPQRALAAAAARGGGSGSEARALPLPVLVALLDGMASLSHQHPRLLALAARALSGADDAGVSPLPPALLAPLARAFGFLAPASGQQATLALLRRSEELGAGAFTPPQLQQLFEAQTALQVRARLAQQRRLSAELGQGGADLAAAGAPRRLAAGGPRAAEPLPADVLGARVEEWVECAGVVLSQPMWRACCDAYAATGLLEAPPANVALVAEVRDALEALALQQGRQQGRGGGRRTGGGHGGAQRPRTVATPDSVWRVPLAVSAGAGQRIAVEPAGAEAFVPSTSGNDAGASHLLPGPRLRWRALRVLHGFHPVVVAEQEWQALMAIKEKKWGRADVDLGSCVVGVAWDLPALLQQGEGGQECVIALTPPCDVRLIEGRETMRERQAWATVHADGVRACSEGSGALRNLVQCGAVRLQVARVAVEPPPIEGVGAPGAAYPTDLQVEGTDLWVYPEERLWVYADVHLLPPVLLECPRPLPSPQPEGAGVGAPPATLHAPCVEWLISEVVAGPLVAGPAGARRSLMQELFALARPDGWEEEAPDPPGLRCSLFAYQRNALAWMAWSEGGRPLADDEAAAVAAARAEGCPVPPSGVLGTGLTHPQWLELELPVRHTGGCDAGGGAGTSVSAGDRAARAARRHAQAPAAGSGAAGCEGSVRLYCDEGCVTMRRPLRLQLPRGGILADEMGLGKTVEVIALILLRPPPRAPPPPPVPSSTPDPSPLQQQSDAATPASAADAAIAPETPPPCATPGPGRGRKKARASASSADGAGGTISASRALLGGAPAAPVVAEGVVPGFPVAGKRAGATLVVLPPALVQQWANELQRHCQLRVVIYEGLRYYQSQKEQQGRKRGAAELAELWTYMQDGPPAAPVYDAEAEAAAATGALLAADVVLTTYTVLSQEVHYHKDHQASRAGSLRQPKRYQIPESPLLQVHWWRVVYDEAQMVGAGMGAVAQMAQRMTARHCWGVTGTPICNEGGDAMTDLLALLRVIRCGRVAEADAFERCILRPWRRGGPDGRRRLAALVRPIMWRNCKASAARHHPLPPVTTQVAMLTFSAAERSFYDQVLDRGAAAHRALADARSGRAAAPAHAADAGGASTAAPAADAASPAPPPPPPSRGRRGGGRRGGGTRSRKGWGSAAAAAATSVESLARAAAGELLQLRLACLHPQLTAYWRDLSGELQLGAGGALSMAEILARMRDAAQLKLQATERELCAALNALAAKLTRRAAAAETAAAAAATGGGGNARGAKRRASGASNGGGDGGRRKRAKGEGAAGGSGEAGGEAGGGAGTSAGGAAASGAVAAAAAAAVPAAVPAERQAPPTAPALRCEALDLLEASFRVGEHGIGAWRASGRSGGGHDLVDRGAGTVSTAAAGAEGDATDGEEDLPVAIASADTSWRAWRFTQVATTQALVEAYQAAGRRLEADHMAVAAQQHRSDLTEGAAAECAKANARVAALQGSIAAREAEMAAAWRTAAAGRVPLQLLEGTADPDAWLTSLRASLSEAAASEVATRATVQTVAGKQTVLLGGVVTGLLSELEGAAASARSAMEGAAVVVQAARMGALVRALQGATAAQPSGGGGGGGGGRGGGGAVPAGVAVATTYCHLSCPPERFCLWRALLRGAGPGDAAAAGGRLRAHAAAAGDALALPNAERLLRRVATLLSRREAAVRRQADERQREAIALPWPVLWAGGEAARARVDVLRLQREAHIAGLAAEVAASEQDAVQAEVAAAAAGDGPGVASLAAKGEAELRASVQELRTKCEALAAHKRFLSHQIHTSAHALAAGARHAPAGAALQASGDGGDGGDGGGGGGGDDGGGGGGGGGDDGGGGGGGGGGSGGSGGAVAGAPRPAAGAGGACEGEDEALECAICKCSMSGEVRVLPCGHFFCSECCESALAGAAPSCPYCRARVVPASVFRVALGAAARGGGAGAGGHPSEVNPPEGPAVGRVRVTGQWMTKLEALLRRLLLRQRTAPLEKTLVFSQWPDALRLVGKALDVNGLRHVTLVSAAGGRDATRRAINSFERDDDVRVFLLALRSGAAGLTLVRANHVVLLEPALTPAIEMQAVARVHRIGQTRPVTVTRLLVAGSVEEEVVAALERRQAAALPREGTTGRQRDAAAPGGTGGEDEDGDGDAEAGASGQATGLSAPAPKAEDVGLQELEAMLAKVVAGREVAAPALQRREATAIVIDD